MWLSGDQTQRSKKKNNYDLKKETKSSDLRRSNQNTDIAMFQLITGELFSNRQCGSLSIPPKSCRLKRKRINYGSLSTE
jgi:hypothetical protein